MDFDDEFENDEDKKEFESFFEQYKKAKEFQAHANEYHRWLMKELKENSFAVIPQKYTSMPNYPICIFYVKQFQPYPLIGIVLN